MRLQSLTHHGAESEVGDIVVVHDIEVNPVGTGGDNIFHLVAQTGEIGGQDGGSDAVMGSHGGDYGVRIRFLKILTGIAAHANL